MEVDVGLTKPVNVKNLEKNIETLRGKLSLESNVLTNAQSLENRIRLLRGKMHLELNLLVNVQSLEEEGTILGRIQTAAAMVGFLEGHLKIAKDQKEQNMELTDKMIKQKTKEVETVSGERISHAFSYGAKWARETLGDTDISKQWARKRIKKLLRKIHSDVDALTICIDGPEAESIILRRIQATSDMIKFIRGTT